MLSVGSVNKGLAWSLGIPGSIIENLIIERATTRWLVLENEIFCVVYHVLSIPYPYPFGYGIDKTSGHQKSRKSIWGLPTFMISFYDPGISSGAYNSFFYDLIPAVIWDLSTP